MSSLSATLHSYTGVWGRVRLSVYSPPDPSRKLPTAYTHFPPGLLYGSLQYWEVLGLERLGRTLIIPSLLTFREDKNGPLLQRKEKKKREREEEKTAGASFHNSTAEELECGSEKERGGEQKET